MSDKNITNIDIPIDDIPNNIAIYRYHDGDFLFIDFNKMAEKTENIRKEEVVGKYLTEVFPGVKEFGLFEILLRVHKNGGPEKMDICFYEDKRIRGWRHNSVNRLSNGDLIVSYTDMTKQKQLEEENIKHKKQLEEAQEIAHIGSWKWDIKSNEIRWSDEVFRIFGEVPQSFTPTYNRFLSYLSKEGQSSLKEAVDNAINNKEQYLFEHEINQKNGTKRYVQESGNAKFDDQGKAVSMVGTVHDITERFHLGEKLRKSESYQRALLDSFPFLFWLKDTQSNFLAVNKAFAKAAGLDDASKLVGKNDLDFFPKDLADMYRTDDKEVMKTLQKKELEEVIEDDGKRKWFETYKAPILDTEGSVFGTVGFARDITESKQAKEKLKLSASVFTYAREGIIITDVNKNIIDVNQAFVEITGFSHADVLGKNPNILQSGRHDENFYRQLWNTLEQDGVWQGELWNRKKSGEEYAEHLTISAVYDDNKVVQNYVALFTDITLQKQQQEELEHIAHYDMLTDLPNRVLFYDRIRQAISQTTRRGKLISVVYIDLDGFKEVNDTYGHNVGDKLLILLAQRMNEQLRAGDTIARVGGDEFIDEFRRKM